MSTKQQRSKQRAESNLEAIFNTVGSVSHMGQVPHRAQSTKLVMESLVQMLASK
jgi:hypothetical protein